MISLKTSSYRFIDPHILAAIADLHLLAKTVVDGFMLGANQSPRPGVGLEFNQYRSYQPGDDLRRIDWKMYARSDRYFVRESEIETSITVRFVLDGSASMAHEERGLKKFEYARFLIASLAYLAHNQGEAIGLEVLSDAGAIHVPAKRDHQQLHRFLYELGRIAPRGKWPGWESVENLFVAVQRRELIVVVSDLHEHHDEIETVLAKLSARKNEVLLFHLLGRDEVDFGYDGHLAFEDLETGQRVAVDAARARKKYLDRMHSRLHEVQQALHDQGIAYELFSLDQPLDFALRKYLTQRMKLSP